MSPPDKPIIVVAGLGRCGTTLMMQMLAAGGRRCLGAAPGYELEYPEACAAAWADPLMRAVKVLDPQDKDLSLLPPHVTLFLTRDHAEEAKSVLKFASIVGGVAVDSNRGARRRVEAGLRNDQRRASAAIAASSVDALPVRFEHILMAARDPAAPAISAVSQFLAGHGLIVDRAAMANAIVRRRPQCLPGLIELEMIR